MRQSGSENRERKLEERKAKEGEMLRKKRRRTTNGGPLRDSKMFFAPVKSLTKDQDLCDTSALNL